MPLFEENEYLQRINKTKNRMRDAGIDVLLLSDPANMNYLSGYDGWSFYVHQMVVIGADADEPIWIGRDQDSNGARLTTFLSEENILGYPDDYVQSATKHPMDYASQALAERGWGDRTIGLEMDGYYFTAAAYQSLRRNLSDATFKDATSLVNWVRIVKSPQEIEYMRQAGNIAERAMRAAIDSINPGVRQCDAVAAIYHAQISGSPEYGGDYTAIAPLLPTGAGTATPHLTWSDEQFKSGEATIVEIAGCRHHYHSPLARTLHLGPPPPPVADAAKVLVDGLNASIEAAKPGATCAEVEAAWRHVIARAGIIKQSRIGYSTGLNYPPDWGEHTVSLRPGDRTVLQPNMTLHVIPGLWTEQYGIDISECVLVTESGAEPLAGFPREYIVKE